MTPKHHSLSVGTSVMHLAIGDLMSFDCYRLIDFGYGTPDEEFRSSHVIEERAQVVVFDRASLVYLLFATHRLFHSAIENVIPMVKKARTACRKGRARQG